mgnify:CR=1 FL=1
MTFSTHWCDQVFAIVALNSRFLNYKFGYLYTYLWWGLSEGFFSCSYSGNLATDMCSFCHMGQCFSCGGMACSFHWSTGADLSGKSSQSSHLCHWQTGCWSLVFNFLKSSSSEWSELRSIGSFCCCHFKAISNLSLDWSVSQWYGIHTVSFT